MPLSQRISTAPTSLRACPDCDRPLLLISIKPGRRGKLMKLYKCSSCYHAEKVVHLDRVLGWLHSELRPPA